MADLLIRYQHVFAQSSEDLGRTDRVQHKINTGVAAPCRQPPRRQPIGKRDIEKQEVLKMLERNVIEPSNSAWSSPIVLVTKKDGSTRFCVDYRHVNDLTVKDAYPIPRVDECLDSLSGSKWFNCLDLNSGFWQIGLDPTDKEKTAFATSLGLYQFTVMPFGLANAPSTLERLMEDVMRGLQWEVCLIYMDDVIVPSATFEDSIARLELVFQRLSEANLKLKPSKCILFQRQVKLLGHIVSEEGISTDNAAVSWMRSLKRPTGQVARWLQELCTYDLTIIHRPGKRHVNADALSRMPCKACKQQQDNSYAYTDQSDAEEEISMPIEDSCEPEETRICAITRQQDNEAFVKGPVLLNGWTHSDIRQSQMEDADIGPILALLEEKKPRPKWTAIANQSSLFKTLWRNWDRLEVHCTVLYRRWSEEDTISDTLQLIVPKSRRLEVIRLHHSIPSAAHLDA